MDLSDPAMVQKYIDELVAYQTRPVAPSEPKVAASSDDGRWQAIAFHDGTVSVWSNLSPEKNNDVSLEALNPIPETIPVPAAEPHWSFTSETKYQCLTFTPDGLYLAGYGNNTLDIYDVRGKQRHTTVNLEASSSCPVFSADGTLAILANNISPTELYIVDTKSGNIAAELTLGEFDVVSMDIASSNRYLVVTTRNSNVGFNSPTNAGLIFDVERVINQ